jgi:hypothetical protein
LLTLSARSGKKQRIERVRPGQFKDRNTTSTKLLKKSRNKKGVVGL